MLPTVVASALDDDAEQLNLTVLSVLRYAEAKSAYDAAKDKTKDLKHWHGSKMMTAVLQNVRLSHLAQVERVWEEKRKWEQEKGER